MNHTEELKKIMERGKKPRSIKQKPVRVELIGARENMNAMQTDLSKCTISGNTVSLPFEQLPNYIEVRKALLNAGAIYNRSTFVFPNDAKPYIDRLMGGESVNIKKEFQFYATPAELAKYLVSIAEVNGDELILEPSAGQGAIIQAVLNANKYCMVHAYELMDINREVLSKIKDCIILGNDFLNSGEIVNGRHTSVNKRDITFDKIIANPPFSKNQDIDHIKEMYRRCKKGGRIVTIASKHWQHNKNKKETAFREWLEEINAEVQEIPKGAFSESGTKIATCIIIINK